MTSVHSTEPEQDVDEDDDEPSWTDFFVPLACFAFAAIPFTPLWDTMADPENARRKYRGVSRLLEAVGPVPFTLAFAGIGVVVLIGLLVQRRKRRSADD